VLIGPLIFENNPSARAFKHPHSPGLARATRASHSPSIIFPHANRGRRRLRHPAEQAPLNFVMSLFLANSFRVRLLPDTLLAREDSLIEMAILPFLCSGDLVKAFSFQSGNSAFFAICWLYLPPPTQRPRWITFSPPSAQMRGPGLIFLFLVPASHHRRNNFDFSWLLERWPEGGLLFFRHALGTILHWKDRLALRFTPR